MRSFRQICCLVLLIGFVLLSTGCQQQMVRLSKEVYIDKCKGAWAGQMFGVSYGAPHEFRTVGRPDLEPINPWTPDRIKNSIGQDDCYVEMTFLEALEKHGLDVTYEQAGQAFAETKYGLAHANLFGRANCRRGIMPPMSGHPKYNRHADDIDFQIEADLLGIICPGMPQESNRICDIFGHIMNYGDGVYGGMFVAGMYAAAYFESEDVEKVIRDGLACIPAESDYHKCITDTIKWYHEYPDNWMAAWDKLEKKWQDNVDCTPAHAFNIDAKINGAYVVMGLLYGQGDPWKTFEVAFRCGQDSDCNPSSASGVLGCMKGYAALDEKIVGGIPAIADQKFSYTSHSFNTLIPACQAMTEKIIERIGGKIADDAYLIPKQQPKAAKLEQWTDQLEIISVAITQHEMDLWDDTWKIGACGLEMSPGLLPGMAGRRNVLALHPVSHNQPGFIYRELTVPNTASPKLLVEVTSNAKGDFVLKVLVNDKVLLDKLIDGKGKWSTETVDLSAYAGRKVTVRVETHSNDWKFEDGFFDKIEVQ